jgi:hypothetical protein
MPLLRVDLQEGFGGEPVLITVNGREHFRKDGVRTRTQIGRADSFELTLPTGPTTIEITARGTTHRVAATLSADLYVGVSITPDGTIVDKQSAHAFGYV